MSDWITEPERPSEICVRIPGIYVMLMGILIRNGVYRDYSEIVAKALRNLLTDEVWNSIAAEVGEGLSFGKAVEWVEKNESEGGEEE